LHVPEGFRDAGPTLRALAAARGLRIGAAVNVQALRDDADYRAVLAAEFNAVTAENAMKFAPFQPERGIFRFDDADELVSFAEAHGMTVRGHTLAWHETLPSWLTEADHTPGELLDILHTHIQTVVDHFRGRVFAWDVVNEAVAEDGSYRDTFWHRHAGPRFVDLAFQWAREADPDARLFYNDFQGEGSGHRAKTIYRFVKRLRARGVPIDGVGLQMHLRADRPPNRRHIVRAVKRFASLGLETHITELDVRVPVPADWLVLDRQASVYGDVFSAATASPGCTNVVLWGFTDRYSWIPHRFEDWGAALPFDDSYRPKPAYAAIATELGKRNSQ